MVTHYMSSGDKNFFPVSLGHTSLMKIYKIVFSFASVQVKNRVGIKGGLSVCGSKESDKTLTSGLTRILWVSDKVEVLSDH